MYLNNRWQRMNGTRGFTLIEILTVIVIMGVILAIGIPSLSEWIARSRVRSGVEDLQNAIRIAQAEAATRNENVEFSLFASQPVPTGNVLSTAASNNGTYWAVRTLPDNIFIQGGDFGSRGVNITGSSTLIFNGIGKVLTNITPPAYLTTTQAYRVDSKTNNPQHQFPICVFVRPGGGLRWCDPNVPTGSLACPAGIPSPPC